MPQSAEEKDTPEERRKEQDRKRQRAKRRADEQRFGKSIHVGHLQVELISLERRTATIEAIAAELSAYRSSVEVLQSAIRAVLRARESGEAEAIPQLLKDLGAAQVSARGHRFNRAIGQGVIRFDVAPPIIRATPMAVRKIDEAPRPANAPLKGAVATWIEARKAALQAPPAGSETFQVDHLDFIGPVYDDGAYRVEGIQTATGIVSALTPKARTDEPVQILIGVPGAGKTHTALEMMSKTKGRIHAFGATVGSREQMLRLSERLGIADRVKVVSKPGELRRVSRVLIDEGARVYPRILQYLQDASEIVVTGDAGQSRADPGECILGALAALGAPVIELTQSRRTASASIQLLSQFVSATQKPVIPSLERIELKRSVEITRCDSGEDLATIVEVAGQHEDCLVVVFDDEMQAALKAAGVRAFQYAEAQGAEAQHVVVHLPEEWKDPTKAKDVPYLSFLNGICRARVGATIVTAAMSNLNIDRFGPHRDRVNELFAIVEAATGDPRRPQETVLSARSRDWWDTCSWTVQALGQLNYGADLIGEWLFIHKRGEAGSYLGAAHIGDLRLGVTKEAVLAAGFAFAERIEIETEEVRPFEAVARIRERLGASLKKPGIRGGDNLRNQIANLARSGV